MGFLPLPRPQSPWAGEGQDLHSWDRTSSPRFPQTVSLKAHLTPRQATLKSRTPSYDQLSPQNEPPARPLVRVPASPSALGSMMRAVDTGTAASPTPVTCRGHP